jgi:serine/threonine-protein kinase RsbW
VSQAYADPPETFTLQVPSDPAYVATARMFSSAVARQFQAGEDEVEELKLAVSEACTGSMRQVMGSEGRVRVTVRHDPPVLWFEVSRAESEPADGEVTPHPDDMATGLGLEIVRALFEDAELARSEEGDPVVRFSVPVPA